MERLDVVVGRLAEQQHSLVTLTQLKDLGVTPEERRTRLERGQWAKADRTVIRITGTPVTWRSRVLAAVLGAGPGAVASHRTAAVLWGLDGIWRIEPEITVPRGRRYRRDGLIIHQSGDIDRVTPTVIDGIPTTLVARTLLDLGAVLPLKVVHLALDDARRRKLTNWNVLLNTLVVHARRGRDGVGTLRAILDEHFGEVVATDSGFERLVLIAVCDAGLPTPVLQHEVQVGRRQYRIDLAYPDPRVAIELDGSVHLRKDVWQADHARQNALVNAGWVVLRYTWQDYREELSRMVREIRAALSRN